MKMAINYKALLIGTSSTNLRLFLINGVMVVFSADGSRIIDHIKVQLPNSTVKNGNFESKVDRFIFII